MTAPSPMDKLGEALRRNTLVRIIEKFGEEHADSHLKDLVIDEDGAGPGDQGAGPPGRQLRLGQLSRSGPRPARAGGRAPWA